MPPDHAPSRSTADLHAVVAEVLTGTAEPECARYLPTSFDAGRLARRLDVLLRSA